MRCNIGLTRKPLRNTRHRRMLQTEWERAVREGKADPDKTFADLHTFETAVASLEHRSQNIMSTGATSHAIERTKAELCGWKNVDGTSLNSFNCKSNSRMHFSNNFHKLSRPCLVSNQSNDDSLIWTGVAMYSVPVKYRSRFETH